MPEKRQFGTRVVCREPLRTNVSDPSKTILDILDDPAVGGGIRHGAAVLLEYSLGSTATRSSPDNTRRLENRTVFKRLGYLLKHFELETCEAIRACLDNLSSGLSAHCGGAA